MSQTLLPRLLLLSSRRRRDHLLLSGDRRRCLSSAAQGRRQAGGHWEEESKAVKVSVWWDFENCQVPAGVNVCRIASRVTAALRASGIRGPVAITAFGDVAQLARPAQEALVATGVALTHVPHGGKNISDRSFMADLVYWIAQNPPPAHFFLISADKDFANILHRLRMSNYNILIACPDSATSVLCCAATIMWPWAALVKGEDFSPKHYNHPPDGLHGSWYGHYKGALDDPFLDMEQQECMGLPPDIRPRAIPKAVVNGIRHALYSYTEGVNLPDLRAELRRNNVFMDKEFFGYKKFSALLQSMPAIVKFIPSRPGEVQPAVIGVYKRVVEPLEQSSETLNSAQSSVGDKSLTPSQNEKQPPSAVPSSPSDLLSKDQKLSPPADPIAEPEQPASHKETDVDAAAGTLSSPEGQGTVSKQGLFERIWILWNGPEPTKPEVSPSHEGAHAEITNDTSNPQQGQNADYDGRLLKRISKIFSRNDNSDGNDTTSAVNANLSSSSAGDHSDEKMAKSKRDTSILQSSEPQSGDASLSVGKAEQEDGSSGLNMGLVSWIARWWKFGKSDADDNATSRNIIDGTRTDSDKESENIKTSTSASGHQVGHDMFTKSYFWDALEQYLLTPRGCDLISKSATREELAHGLQKLGSWPLKGLKEQDLHHWIDLLVSERKWIEESPSRYFPFRLTLPRKRTCVQSHSSKSNGLSSLFTDEKHVDDRARRNRPLAREEILSDCHKLLKELLLQYKHGFNVSIFKRLFAQKYGYELNHQKLGYPELESLLRIMPGVRIKAPKILPVEYGKGQAVGRGSENQSNGDDFIWEEFGPISDMVKTTEETDKEVSYHPPSISDDEFSDDENYASQQPRKDEEQSSLLQIIDSWSSSKDGGASKKPQGIDGLVDCSRSNLGNNLYSLIPGDAQKPARPPHGQYSFVSDSEDDKEKNKLVDSVLGSLQRAGSSRLHG